MIEYLSKVYLFPNKYNTFALQDVFNKSIPRTSLIFRVALFLNETKYNCFTHNASNYVKNNMFRSCKQ